MPHTSKERLSEVVSELVLAKENLAKISSAEIQPVAEHLHRSLELLGVPRAMPEITVDARDVMESCEYVRDVASHRPYVLEFLKIVAELQPKFPRGVSAKTIVELYNERHETYFRPAKVSTNFGPRCFYDTEGIFARRSGTSGYLLSTLGLLVISELREANLNIREG